MTPGPKSAAGKGGGSLPCSSGSRATRPAAARPTSSGAPTRSCRPFTTRRAEAAARGGRRRRCCWRPRRSGPRRQQGCPIEALVTPADATGRLPSTSLPEPEILPSLSSLELSEKENFFFLRWNRSIQCVRSISRVQDSICLSKTRKKSRKGEGVDGEKVLPAFDEADFPASMLLSR